MMAEIKCPNCGTVFQIDESVYDDIVKQVRDREFNQQLQAQKQQLESAQQARLELEVAKTREQSGAQLADQQRQIDQLKARLASAQKDQQLAVSAAQSEKDKVISEKDQQIAMLKQQAASADQLHEARKQQELALKDGEIQKLRQQLESRQDQTALELKNTEDRYKDMLSLKDQEIERLKDFKLSQSTKMVGEDLEQYCYNEFNRYRAAAFPNAYFEKDNDASQGTKGDFIYREKDGELEILSIMFEMKNEIASTDKSIKHKNEDFFKKLDKDRHDKKCEFAVLVSMLEPENEFYNSGIADVSFYGYPKMYVVRPQFFIPLITILRSGALKNVEYRRQLQQARDQNIDITNFENDLNEFKDSFNYNTEQAHKRFEEAIAQIDKAIDDLTKTRDKLIASGRQLRLANNKAQDLNVRKLTYGNKTMKEMFDQLEQEEK